MTKKLLISLVVALAGFAMFSAACEPSHAERMTANVDMLFAEWNRPDSPGCSLGVTRRGTTVYERGYGLANVELRTPITPASVFHVASISKQFTAMSILLLAKRGQLSIDDEVTKYIPEWADRDSHLTLRHLLNQTSGLRDGFGLLGLAAPRDDGLDVNDALVRMLARQRGLNFVPGTEFEYSNAGYTLLANIVKRVSGQSLGSFADANIFKPLGMTHTHVHDDPRIIVPNRAWGYTQDASGLHAAVHGDLGHLVGTTGLFTTTGDLLRWEQNFAGARVGDQSLLASMQTPAVSTGWANGSSYGFGLEIGQYRGLRTVGHGGGDPGYGAYVVRYPDQELAVALLCNLDNIGARVEQLAEHVAEIFLEAAFTQPTQNESATVTAGSASADALSLNEGLYRDSTTGLYGRIFIREGKLRASESTRADAPSAELTPVSSNRFVIQGTPVVLEFRAAADGTQELLVTGVGGKPTVSRRSPEMAFAPTTGELRAFAGKYTSQELDTTCSVLSRESGLAMEVPGRAEMTLQPIVRDTFDGMGGVVEFSREARGAPTGFTLHTSGVRNLRFERVTH